jgi:hypothetical protein
VIWLSVDFDREELNIARGDFLQKRSDFDVDNRNGSSIRERKVERLAGAIEGNSQPALDLNGFPSHEQPRSMLLPCLISGRAQIPAAGNVNVIG